MANNSKTVQKKADDKRKANRSRNWWFTLYPDDLPDDWLEQLENLKIRMVLSPLHNQDFNADGTPKKPHYHVIFLFESHKSLKQMQDLFINLFGQTSTGSIYGVANILPDKCIVHDKNAAVRYLAHLDNPEKAQYNPDEIRGFNGVDILELLKHTLSEVQDMMVAMEEFIEEYHITELSEFSKAIRYEHPDWYLILSTKATYYFNNFIRSYRHSHLVQNEDGTQELAFDEELAEEVDNPCIRVNPDTGEVIG